VNLGTSKQLLIDDRFVESSDGVSLCMNPPVQHPEVLMMPSAYYHWGEDDYPATMDVQLLTSRDGVNWRRAGDRKPFLRRGLDGTTSGGMIFANPWLIQMGDELWFYYAGTQRNHGDASDAPKNSGILRATMRLDGFVSLDAGYGGGQFMTPELQFEGQRLELNMDGSAGGWVKVEIQDRHGQPLPGFGLGDADAAVGNRTAKTVTWQGQADLSDLAGTNVRLRFAMRDLKLYAFGFPRAGA